MTKATAKSKREHELIVNRDYSRKYRAKHHDATLVHARRSYYKNRDKRLTKLQEIYQEEREWLNEQKCRPCMDCENMYPPWVMDFDHVRGKKKRTVGSMVGRQLSKKTILAEIAKCELVCANCHRNRTWERRQWGGNKRGPSPFEN